MESAVTTPKVAADAAADGEKAVSPTSAGAQSGGEASGDAEAKPRSADKKQPGKKKAKVRANRVRETRIERMMSKAELARRAGLSVLTIDRVEKGLGCRMDTKRKILEALGLSLADRVRVFGEEE